jgi:hypothetical protein
MTSPTKAAPSGTEIMLRTLGLDGVIGAAKELANAGSVARIMAFADQAGALAQGVGAIGARLDRLEALAGLIAGKLGIDPAELAAALARIAQAAAEAGAGPVAGAGADPGGARAEGGGGADPGQPRAA